MKKYKKETLIKKLKSELQKGELSDVEALRIAKILLKYDKDGVMEMIYNMVEANNTKAITLLLSMIEDDESGLYGVGFEAV